MGNKKVFLVSCWITFFVIFYTLSCSSVWASTKSWNFLDSSDYIYDNEHVEIKDMRVVLKKSQYSSLIKEQFSQGISKNLQRTELYYLGLIDTDGNYLANGTFTSTVIDGQENGLLWKYISGFTNGPGIRVSVKAADSKAALSLLPFINLSVDLSSAGIKLNSIKGRYFQYKLVFSTDNLKKTPLLYSLSLQNSLATQKLELKSDDLALVDGVRYVDNSEIDLEKQDDDNNLFKLKGYFESDIFDAGLNVQWKELGVYSNLLLDPSVEKLDGFSITTRFELDEVNVGNQLIVENVMANGNYSLFYTGSKIIVLIENGDGSHKAVSSDYALKNNTEYFLAASFSSNGDIVINLDGVELLTLDYDPLLIDDVQVLNGRIISSQEYDYLLLDPEIQVLYNKENSKLQVQLRSCDNDSCSGNDYIGPDGTSESFFDGTKLIDLSTKLAENQYFQYKLYLESDNESLSPLVFDTRVSYLSYPLDSPSIHPKNTNGGNCPPYSYLLSFKDASNDGFVSYQITNEGLSANPLWYYWTGTSWQLAGDARQSNTANEVSANIGSFMFPGKNFSFKAFLNPREDTFSLNAVALEYSELSEKDKAALGLVESESEMFQRLGVDKESTSAITLENKLFTRNQLLDIKEALEENSIVLPFLDDITYDILIRVNDLSDPTKSGQIMSIRKANEYWGAKEIQRFLLIRLSMSQEEATEYAKQIQDKKLFIEPNNLGISSSLLSDIDASKATYLNKLFRKKLLKQTIIKNK